MPDHIHIILKRSVKSWLASFIHTLIVTVNATEVTHSWRNTTWESALKVQQPGCVNSMNGFQIMTHDSLIQGCPPSQDRTAPLQPVFLHTLKFCPLTVYLSTWMLSQDNNLEAHFHSLNCVRVQLTPRYIWRRPSPRGTSSLHTRNIHSLLLQHCHMFSLVERR